MTRDITLSAHHALRGKRIEMRRLDLFGMQWIKKDIRVAEIIRNNHHDVWLPPIGRKKMSHPKAQTRNQRQCATQKNEQRQTSLEMHSASTSPTLSFCLDPPEESGGIEKRSFPCLALANSGRAQAVTFFTKQSLRPIEIPSILHEIS